MGSFHFNLACTLFPGVSGLNLTKGILLTKGALLFWQTLTMAEWVRKACEKALTEMGTSHGGTK